MRADPVFLDRILSNLLENAAKAVDDEDAGDDRGRRPPFEQPGGGPRDRPRARRVRRSAREQLFYPFYRMDDRNPRLGSGLGLAICKGFVTLLDGDIWIEDTPGGGATFSFTLPSADGGAQLRKERILVVDDEAQIRKALNRALVARGYEVEAAVDGEEALLLAESFAPDLVVLDLNLPGIDGFEVCRRLRTWSATPDHRAVGPRGRERQGRGARPRRRRLPDEAVRDRRAPGPRPRPAPSERGPERAGRAAGSLRRARDRPRGTPGRARRRGRATHEDGVGAARGVREPPGQAADARMAARRTCGARATRRTWTCSASS